MLRGGLQVARLLQSGRDDLSMLQTPAADREGVRTPLSSAGPMSPSLRQVTVGKLVQRIERLQQQLHFTARGGEGGAEEGAHCVGTTAGLLEAPYSDEREVCWFEPFAHVEWRSAARTINKRSCRSWHAGLKQIWDEADHDMLHRESQRC